MAFEEKRRRPRINLTSPITVVRANGQSVPGQSMDVSMLGCRFSAEVLLKVGERISTSLRFPSGTTHPIEGIIKSISEDAPYQYGVAFTPETIERLIKALFRIS